MMSTRRQLMLLGGALLAGYVVLVRQLRFKRMRELAAKFNNKASLSRMTLEDAYKIQTQLATLEFPTIFSVSVFFALFKTYAVPSISALLVATGQLADEATASKRAADTGVILTEVILHHPSDERAANGIARMNYLHGLYRKSGKISDDDMLYTLSLFALEAGRWVERFEWRQLNEVEVCASGTYWRYMADAMEIPLSRLPSNPRWDDGTHFLDELKQWSLQYESEQMVPARTNKAMAEGTIAIGLYNVPRLLRPMISPLAMVLIEPHVRKAMLLDEPPVWATTMLQIVISIRKFLLLHLSLPRPYVLRDRWWSEEANAHGRYNAKQFISLPWYIEPTMFARWGPKAWLLRFVGGKVPGDDGEQYMPAGYVLSEIGPQALRGKGQEEMAAYCESIRSSQRRCPFR